MNKELTAEDYLLKFPSDRRSTYGEYVWSKERVIKAMEFYREQSREEVNDWEVIDDLMLSFLADWAIKPNGFSAFEAWEWIKTNIINRQNKQS